MSIKLMYDSNFACNVVLSFCKYHCNTCLLRSGKATELSRSWRVTRSDSLTLVLPYKELRVGFD